MRRSTFFSASANSRSAGALYTVLAPRISSVSTFPPLTSATSQQPHFAHPRRQPMVRHRPSDRRRALRHVQAVHRQRLHVLPMAVIANGADPSPVDELPRVAQASRLAEQEVTVQRNDHLRLLDR